MVFVNYTNNAQNIPVVATFTDVTPTILLKTWEGDLLPETNGRVTIEMLDNSWDVIKREVIKYTSRTDDLLTWLTRAVESCVQNDTVSPRIETQSTLDFTPWEWQIVVCSLRYTALNDKEIKDDIEALKTSKANDNAVVKLTGAQTIAWVKTFSSSPIVPAPTTDMQAVNKEYVDDQTSNITNLVPRNTFDFIAWESLVPWDILRYGLSLWWETISQNSWTYEDTRDYVWYDNTSTKIWQSFTIVSWWSLSTIKIRLFKRWTPTSNLTLKILDWASWTANVLFTSSNTIAESSLTWTESEYTFNFSWIITPWFYYMELSVPRANSTSNYTVWITSTWDAYAWWTMYYINNTWVWSSIARDRRMVIAVTASTEDNNKVYKALASSTLTSKVVWACFTTQALDSAFKWVIWWVLWWFTWLTKWEVYYLQNIWTIALTAWTTSVKVGKAISATEINFITPL